jgi:hypothetical protein
MWAYFFTAFSACGLLGVCHAAERGRHDYHHDYQGFAETPSGFEERNILTGLVFSQRRFRKNRTARIRAEEARFGNRATRADESWKSLARPRNSFADYREITAWRWSSGLAGKCLRKKAVR